MPVPKVPSAAPLRSVCAEQGRANPNNSVLELIKFRHASEYVPSRVLQHSCSHQPPETPHEVRAGFWQEISDRFFFFIIIVWIRFRRNRLSPSQSYRFRAITI